jgi:hemolysin activation/secretion protein
MRLVSAAVRIAFASLLLATVTPVFAQAVSAPPAPAAAPEGPAFDILEFRVEGSSVLSEREIERAVMPFLGEQRRFADVEGARKALEDAFQKAGYQTVFVDIPEQRIVGGVIRLRVLEGRVGQLRVTGTRYFEAGEIRAGVSELARGRVPDFLEMQQELAQVNRSPDRQVSPILTPGRIPGTVDVNLSVRDSLPLHGDIEDDNYASPFTTSNRLNAALHYDNLWQRHHSIAVNYQVSPRKRSETNVLYATYLWHFSSSEDVLSLYGIRSNSNIAVVGGANILGNAKIAGARWISPLGSVTGNAVSYFHSLTLGIDRKDFAQTNISAASSSLTVLPPISYYPLSLSYGATRASESSTGQFSLGLTTAPRAVLGNTDEKFQARRSLGGASWLAWKFDMSLEEGISRRWSAFGRLDGQWTLDPLIPNEQFSTGGATSIRGYRESEISGDRGMHATLEARWYPVGRPGAESRRSLYLCAFVDGGQVRIVDPAGPQVSLISIASTGLGVHAQDWHGVHLALDGARALRDGGQAAKGPITARGAWRLEASVGYGF